MREEFHKITMWQARNFFGKGKSLFYFLVLISLQQDPAMAAPLALNVQAQSALLINAASGAVLYEKNARQEQYPASITKIATAAYALEVAPERLPQLIAATRDALGSVSEDAKRRSNYTLPAYWLVHDASHIGIKVGEELTLKDLLYGMMVPSGDDAANVIATALGGTIPHFMELLNDYLKKLGCQQTQFYNPHGLFHPKHVTTAYDMAKLTAHALKNSTFREIVATTRYVRPKSNKQEATVLVQTNRLLKKGKCFYPKAIGVKTGYIAKAQNTLVAAAVHGDRTLIAVLLKCEEREQIFLDAAKLFEAAFNQPKVERLLLKPGETAYRYFPEGASQPIATALDREVTLQFYPAEEPELSAFLHWKNLPLPIEKGECVGNIIIKTSHNKVLMSVPLHACERVTATWSHWLRTFWGK
jgi:D-alanyl-D-alanine carboxypeptidase (penicillin-binding protein 5/6)